MLPVLDDGFSVPRFIGELRDVGSLVSNLKNFWEYLHDIPRFIRKFKNTPLNKLSGSWLSAIFGWLPFVSDIKSLVNRFFSVREDVDEFLEHVDKRLTYHFQKALSPETFKDSEWFEPVLTTAEFEAGPQSSAWHFAEDIFSNVELQYELTREVKNVSFHATLEYRYRIPLMENRGLQRLLAEMDYWGLNISISDVWELIPFSFVVDWVFNIGNLLREVDFVNLPIQVIIYDYCRSIKYDLIETYEAVGVENVQSGYPFGELDETAQWIITPGSHKVVRTTECYYRWPGIPDPSDVQLPNLTFPSGMKWVIGAALGGSFQRRY
jgi:hypothetical protein